MHAVINIERGLNIYSVRTTCSLSSFQESFCLFSVFWFSTFNPSLKNAALTTHVAGQECFNDYPNVECLFIIFMDIDEKKAMEPQNDSDPSRDAICTCTMCIHEIARDFLKAEIHDGPKNLLL